MLHRFGSFELDERRFELRRRGKPVPLQRRVLEAIAFLVRNPDRLISKEELLEGPWKGATVGDAALAHVIMVARKALAERGKEGSPIQTVRGKGFRFVAKVTTTAGVPAQSSPRARSRSKADQEDAFLGRAHELEVLSVAATAAICGHGRLVLIGGEPGIGKTSLLERFASTAGNMEVLWGRCWEGGGAPAFWPWLEIVRAYVDRNGQAAITLMQDDASEIARWIPELRQKQPTSTPPPTAESDQSRFRTFDSISQYLRRAAAVTPLLVVIEDLHAADDASVLLLQFLLRLVEGSRLLIAASYRDLEVKNRPVLAAFLGGPLPHAVPMTLSGLRQQEVAELLARTLHRPPPSDLVRRVFKATNGNPFLLGELGRTVLATSKEGRIDRSYLDSFSIPRRVVDIVRRHLKHLPSSTVAALSTASVIGREFDLHLLHELHGTAPDRGIDDLEPALVEGVIKETVSGPGVYAFSHALIRETLYHELPPTQRLSLHFSAAERLERRQVSDHAIAFQMRITISPPRLTKEPTRRWNGRSRRPKRRGICSPTSLWRNTTGGPNKCSISSTATKRKPARSFSC